MIYFLKIRKVSIKQCVPVEDGSQSPSSYSVIHDTKTPQKTSYQDLEPVSSLDGIDEDPFVWLFDAPGVRLLFQFDQFTDKLK